MKIIIESTSSPMTYEEFMEFAKEHYNEGGDVAYECWEEYQFDDYVKEFGPMTKEQALSLFKTYDNIDW